MNNLLPIILAGLLLAVPIVLYLLFVHIMRRMSGPFNKFGEDDPDQDNHQPIHVP